MNMNKIVLAQNSSLNFRMAFIYVSLFVFCAYLLFYGIGVYSMCDGPALSHRPYLGTVTSCSFVLIILLSVKACGFTVNSQRLAEASSSPSRQKLHLKKSWGMCLVSLVSCFCPWIYCSSC